MSTALNAFWHNDHGVPADVRDQSAHERVWQFAIWLWIHGLRESCWRFNPLIPGFSLQPSPQTAWTMLFLSGTASVLAVPALGRANSSPDGPGPANALALSPSLKATGWCFSHRFPCQHHLAPVTSTTIKSSAAFIAGAPARTALSSGSSPKTMPSLQTTMVPSQMRGSNGCKNIFLGPNVILETTVLNKLWFIFHCWEDHTLREEKKKTSCQEKSHFHNRKENILEPDTLISSTRTDSCCNRSLLPKENSRFVDRNSKLSQLRDDFRKTLVLLTEEATCYIGYCVLVPLKPIGRNQKPIQSKWRHSNPDMMLVLQPFGFLSLVHSKIFCSFGYKVPSIFCTF